MTGSTRVDYPLSMQRAKMVRSKEWKLIYRQDGDMELYSLIEDPDEMNNRAKDPSCRQVVFDLMQELIKWMMRTETDYPLIDKLYA